MLDERYDGTSIGVANSSLKVTYLQPNLLFRASAQIRAYRKGLSQGFTLVELMIVVAIVGILSAVALPNFLSQTDKAKATEAKTNLATTLKAAHAKFLEDVVAPSSTNATMNSNYGTPEDDETKFNYEQVSWSDPVWTIKAVGNDTDSGLTDKELDACVNFDTGKVDVQSALDSTTAVDCT